MASPHNVEFEAAKFLQKLIHESTDEPSKLATKLYVILQHMKASGKENSMPYQVISRAMETVINQHGLDIDALMSSRIPMSGGSHSGEAARAQAAGCTQSVGAATDSKLGVSDTDGIRTDGFASSRMPAVPSSMGHDPFKVPVSQRSTLSFDHESPSSMDTRSTNSHSQDRRETASWEQQGGQKDSKRASIKRKRSESSASEPRLDGTQQPDCHTSIPDMVKESFTSKVEMPGAFPGSPSSDPFPGKGMVDSEHWKQGFLKGTAPNFWERPVPAQLLSANQGDVSMTNVNSASHLDVANTSQMSHNADGLLQGSNTGNLGAMSMLRSATSRDTGKSAANAACVTSMPFKEHHLKQLRAQCLVFLAFRNGLPPKRLHLEIALGNILPKEGPSGSVHGAQNELVADKGKQQTTLDYSSIADVTCQQGNLANVAKIERVPTSSVGAVRVSEVDPISKEADYENLIGDKPGPLTDPYRIDEEKKHLSSRRGILEAETQSQETTNSSAFLATPSQSVAHHGHDEKLQPAGTHHATGVMGVNKHLKSEMVGWTGVAHDPSRGPLSSSFQHDLGTRKDSSPFLSQHCSSPQIIQHADGHVSASRKAIQGVESEHHRPVPGNDSNLLHGNASNDDSGALEIQARSNSDASKVVAAADTSYKHKSFSPLAHIDRSSEVEEEDMSQPAGLPPSPRCSLSERWIRAHQKRKVVAEQKWGQKLQKADQRIVACFNDLKETVSSSEDISAKTRSVIELKKLQLLELQRRLRRNIMNDFFKPIQTEMDRLKSIKKHRIGRRLKHVEKYEQKMKEERQKRIRERQKEFFSEIEVHKERLEDMFKFKRERCKGFNRYVKEFHKRKERIHREKIDRIQREKINLLKINDVEGYLRMVQDAKSDRVKQLLKETEKYLLKLGSKLKEAKSVARQADMDDNRIMMVDESSETAFETEDENDQAKHYKESNEKYYMIAHSIKENITEQPTGLQGGKLREYQMNGLRWLVSLYNNHLNGILADEMGLGKTVQVISLICYLMEKKNDRGPFLVVVPSSVLPGWVHEMSFWAPSINKIVYAGPPEERRKLFKENIVHQKFNVLLTTYEYLMNKHDRPKLSKIHWHYVIIDEGHRIKNASCKLNADLKLYHSSHRLLLTGTPLQNNLEELWALLNFLLPNIFNSSEDFSQWFNKPFESNGDNSPDEALLSEEENLLIINRLHQVLRPFVLRRLKHKVENQLPEKIERLVRCEASAYQKLLMKRVEENLGSLGMTKARAVHNSVVELRNICNHPYLSQLHAEEVDSLIPKHFLPPIIRLCGKLEMLDRFLPKLKATNHRVLFFSTMTRLLDVMEEYLVWKQYRYLRLDGHTSGQDRGALIDKFNHPDSPFFIFLLSIRAGGVGVNLQAADTVIIFDTDWNPQVDLQAQARAHRIGQKKDVLVLRLETVHTVEEQVRAAAEHKLGVANQSITAGFFDNNTSAEDRREYLESLLRESKKEEAAPVLDDDGLNDILARSGSEIDIFEAVDQKRREEEMSTWKRLVVEQGGNGSVDVLPLPSRLVTDDDLKAFYEAMKVYEVSSSEPACAGVKRKGGYLGGLDTLQYGRGKRAREVRSYEEQWTEEEFEKMCQVDPPETAKAKEEQMDSILPLNSSQTSFTVEPPSETPQVIAPLESASLVKKEVTPPVKRGRGRPRRTPIDASVSAVVHSTSTGVSKSDIQQAATPSVMDQIGLGSHGMPSVTKEAVPDNQFVDVVISPSSQVISPLPPPPGRGPQATSVSSSVPSGPKQQGRRGQLGEDMPGQPGTETVRRRGRKPSRIVSSVPSGSVVQVSKPSNQAVKQPSFDTSASVTTTRINARGTSVAESVDASLTKSLDDSTGLTVDSKASEIPVMRDAVATSEAPQTGTILHKSNVLPQGQNACVLGSSGITVEDPKPNEQSFKQVLLDASSVNATPPALSDVGRTDIATLGQGTSTTNSSMGSSATLVVGNIPPAKVGQVLHTSTPNSAVTGSESAKPSSTGPRSGNRQSHMPQSGTEPARRRGRKRGQTISATPDLPSTPDPGTNKPLNNSASVVEPIVTYVATPSVSANQVMASHVTVPTVPVVPVSGFTPDSTVFSGSSGSVHHISMGFAASIVTSSQSDARPSGTLDIPSVVSQLPSPVQAQEQGQKGQVGEMAPRRRGRKKSIVSPAGLDNLNGQDSFSKQPDAKTGEVVERKVIATRSRQINISQPKNAQEVGRGDTSIIRGSKDLKLTVSSKLSSRPKDQRAVASPSGEGYPATVNDSSKSLVTRRATLTEEIKLCCSPADLPPISRSGRTNVIVLALESPASGVDPTGMYSGNVHALEECSELQKDRTSAHNSGAQASSTVTIHLEEEMSAPPGFDTPRPCLSAAAARKPLESIGSGISKFADVLSPVVLALESSAQNVVPSSTSCLNVSEKEESHLLQTMKGSALGKILSSKPKGSEAAFVSSADAMMTLQPEEEISAPPGFDVPQHPLSEIAVAEPLACENVQVKQDIPVACNAPVDPGSMADIVSEKNKLSCGLLNTFKISITAASSSCIGNSQPSQIECRAVHVDSLPMVGSVSGDTIAESSGLVEDSSIPPGFGVSKTCLLDDKNNTQYEGGDTQLPSKHTPSKCGSDSDSQCLLEGRYDDMHTTKTEHVTDIPIVEYENISAAVSDVNMQNKEASFPDRDLVLQLEEDSGVKASASKFEAPEGGREIAAVEKGHIFHTFRNETCEDGSNLKEPSPSSSKMSASLNSQTVEKTQAEEPRAFASVSEPGDSENNKLIAISITSTDNLKCALENVEIGDACQDSSACETGTDSQYLGEPKNKMNAATLIAQCSANPASSDNDVAKQTQLDKASVLASVLGPGDDEDNKLGTGSITGTNDFKRPKQNINIEGAGQRTDDACEIETDAQDIMTGPVKEMDVVSLSMTEVSMAEACDERNSCSLQTARKEEACRLTIIETEPSTVSPEWRKEKPSHEKQIDVDDSQIASSVVTPDMQVVSVLSSEVEEIPEACDYSSSEHGADNAHAGSSVVVSVAQAASPLESLEMADFHVTKPVECNDDQVEQDKFVACNAVNHSESMSGIGFEKNRSSQEESKSFGFSITAVSSSSIVIQPVLGDVNIQKKEASCPVKDSGSEFVEGCGVGPSVSKFEAGNSEVEISAVVKSPAISTFNNNNVDSEDGSNLKETSPIDNRTSFISETVGGARADQPQDFASVSEPRDDENKKLNANPIASPIMSIDDFESSKKNVKLEDGCPEDSNACETRMDSHVVSDAMVETNAARINTQNPASPISSKYEAAKKNEPENALALASVLEPGDDDSIKLGASIFTSTKDLKSSKQHTDSVVTGLKTDGTCGMEIDSPNVMVQSVQSMDAATVVIPEACHEDKTCHSLSTVKEEGCGKTITNVPTESGTMSSEGQEDNTSPGSNNDIDVSQTASCLVASETASVLTSKVEEMPEGNKGVLENTLAELRGQIENDDQTFCSCNKVGLKDGTDGAVSSRHMVSDDINTDTSTFTSKAAESRKLEENMGVTDVEHKDSSYGKVQSVDSGVDTSVISQPEATKEAVSYPALLTENVEDLEHQAEGSAGTLHNGVKDGSSLLESDACKAEGINVQNLAGNGRVLALHDEKLSDTEDDALDGVLLDRLQIACALGKAEISEIEASDKGNMHSSSSSENHTESTKQLAGGVEGTSVALVCGLDKAETSGLEACDAVSVAGTNVVTGDGCSDLTQAMDAVIPKSNDCEAKGEHTGSLPGNIEQSGLVAGGNAGGADNTQKDIDILTDNADAEEATYTTTRVGSLVESDNAKLVQEDSSSEKS